jgi:hypothetical protein
MTQKTFETGMSYQLKYPTSYDDEFGEGYTRVETYGKIECEGMYIVDCWVVNEQGEIHPGMTESPVPVNFNDVIAESARPAVNGERARKEFASWN